MGKRGLATITVNDKKVVEKRFEKTQPGILTVDDIADVGVDDGTKAADYIGFSKSLEKSTL